MMFSPSLAADKGRECYPPNARSDQPPQGIATTKGRWAPVGATLHKRKLHLVAQITFLSLIAGEIMGNAPSGREETAFPQ